ncbi:DUF72 domain-containing protein [Acaryochloris marina]|uniref:DUF72 domain-containing protein n=1 Tax=Acaryochloris marina (strain MBIC 11017) TaxID=329726 RepID=B0BZI4_ACAM1|nr:DUF72 domain-containing protein [Acaryochloris marina]ABW30729.1 conserved hypothetical protein [Acaryochloris marina MBIC11017]BDM79507.1 hypothetical protein AM10699_23750 [Acaryochloris marina MBIC10699]
MTASLSEPKGNFYLGCAIWAYKGWLGDFYPQGSSSSRLLPLYAERLTTVEVNATFYSTPSPETVRRWAEQTPDTFRFCPKFPRTVSHAGLLHPHKDEAVEFIQLMQGLGPRLGPLFVQLPPSYGPQQLSDLETFLTEIKPSDVPIAVEVRHPQWFQPPYANQFNDLLSSLQIGRVLLDSRPIYQGPDDPQVHSQRRKPKLPLQPVTTAPFTVVRYISHPQRELNDVFLGNWINILQTWLRQGIDTYFFVHCPLEEQSPRTAQLFQQLLQEQIAIPPLPWNQLTPPSTQLSLF